MTHHDDVPRDVLQVLRDEFVTREEHNRALAQKDQQIAQRDKRISHLEERIDALESPKGVNNE